jgi:hypothetical protein
MVVHAKGISHTSQIVTLVWKWCFDVEHSLLFEAVIGIAMKKKVPEAAAVPPGPNEKQHADTTWLHRSYVEMQCRRAHLLSAVKVHVSTGSQKRLKREKWLRTYTNIKTSFGM